MADDLLAGLGRSLKLPLGLIEALADGTGRCLVQQTEHHDGDAGKDEARDDFVQTQPAELFPDGDGDGTGADQ